MMPLQHGSKSLAPLCSLPDGSKASWILVSILSEMEEIWLASWEFMLMTLHLADKVAFLKLQSNASVLVFPIGSGALIKANFVEHGTNKNQT